MLTGKERPAFWALALGTKSGSVRELHKQLPSNKQALQVHPPRHCAPPLPKGELDTIWASPMPVRPEIGRARTRHEQSRRRERARIHNIRLGTIILSLACVFLPRSGTGTIEVFDDTGAKHSFAMMNCSDLLQ